jgi:putative acetyltransferase
MFNNTFSDMLQVRRALPEDVETVSRLFRKTIRSVNSKDYEPDQLKAWSSGYKDTVHWKQRIKSECFLIAEKDKRIVGFGSLDNSGVLGMMYVHKDHQGNGVGKALMNGLESYAAKHHIREIVSEVSITARPFFIRMGFIAGEKQSRELSGVKLTNQLMMKRL